MNIESLFNNPNNNPLQGTVLDRKIFSPAYLFDWLVKIYHFIFRFETVHALNTIFLFLSLFFITLIIYCIVRLLEIRKKEHEHLHHEIAEYAHHQAEREKSIRDKESISHNERWRQVLDYLFSVSAADWKLSVIEADAMLDTLLDQLGFLGENLGEKLKSADQTKFRSLPVAWEVHTIRNRIAHEGSAFALSQHEAKRVIALYESIFRQYGYI